MYILINKGLIFFFSWRKEKRKKKNERVFLTEIFFDHVLYSICIEHHHHTFLILK